MRLATRLLRVGAIGLNPKWGLRNPSRDILDSPFGFEYAKLGPLSAISGHLRAIGYKMGVPDEDAKRHWAMGIPMATFLGQSGKDIKPLVKKVMASTPTQKLIASAYDTLGTVEGIIGFSEHGTRLAETAAAWKWAKEQRYSDEDAAITATIAGKDATTDYTRGGEATTQINQGWVFFRAQVNYLDRVARKAYKHPLKTLGKGFAWLTIPALLSYLANRDEEWWQDLPPWEKWGNLFVPVPWSKQPQRIPLPFFMGRVFGSLPIAAIEEFRTPGSFSEAILEMKNNESPELFPTLVEGARQIALNKDWTGRQIVPQRLLGKEKRDQFTEETSPLAVIAGNMTGQSPMLIEHLVDYHTGGLFKRVSRAIDNIQDPSVITKDPSTWPVISGLFLKEGRSRVMGDHYDREEKLSRKRKSDRATAEEIGELIIRKNLSRELNDLWAQRRDIQLTVKPMSASKPQMDAIADQMNAKIRELGQLTEKDFLEAGRGFVLWNASSPNPTESQATEAGRVVKGMSKSEIRSVMKAEAKKRGMTTLVWGKQGKLTPLGERIRRIENYEWAAD